MMLLAWLACHPGAETPIDTGTPDWTTPPAPPPVTITDGDIAPVVLEVDAAMPLMIHVTFPDPGSTEAWIEYRFETDAWQVAPTVEVGEGTVLGIPERTDVEVRVAALVDADTLYSGVGVITTGEMPAILLQPHTSRFDPARAVSAPWAMISVATGRFTFSGPYFVEIFDRAGRVVWFHRIRDGLFCLNPSVALDGTHIWYEAENIFGLGTGLPGVTRQTLDGRWVVDLPVPSLGQAIGEGPDGSFFYEFRSPGAHRVDQLHADGTTSVVWDCDVHMQSIGRDPGECLLNTSAWTEARNTVLASQFETSTVFEIDLATGQAVRQFGQLDEGDPYTFVPPESEFAYQHFPNWTAEGTLLVSTHAPCDNPNCDPNFGKWGVQLAAEYEVNDATKRITRIGVITSTDLWATQAGEACRLENGNLIQGYGQDGAARELTAEGDVVWQVVWDKDASDYRAVGHLSLIDDLYELNRAP